MRQESKIYGRVDYGRGPTSIALGSRTLRGEMLSLPCPSPPEDQTRSGPDPYYLGMVEALACLAYVHHHLAATLHRRKVLEIPCGDIRVPGGIEPLFLLDLERPAVIRLTMTPPSCFLDK